MAYIQKNNPFKMQGKDESLSPEEQVAKAQGREVGEMNRSSRFHPDNVGRGVKTAAKMKSPMKGKKDACYHKVKNKVDVWPSAYASGQLVQCRKAGAANWGTKSKK
jgi:hypothetical protein